MVLVPAILDTRNSDELFAEFENPTPLSEDIEWKFAIVSQCRPGPRTRSITELMFCMLRAKHSAANTQ